MWRYGVFAGWATAAAAVRLQALVLLPAFLLAVALDALAARDHARLRPLVALGVPSRRSSVSRCRASSCPAGELSSETSSAPTRRSARAPVAAARLDEVAWHALDVAILGLAIPVLAIAVLAYVVFARHDPDPALRAFVAVALAYVSLLVVQVGLFSAEFVGHVAERYLSPPYRCSRSGSAPGSLAGRRARSLSSFPFGPARRRAPPRPARADRRARDARQHAHAVGLTTSRATRCGRRSSRPPSSLECCSSRYRRGWRGRLRSSSASGSRSPRSTAGTAIADASEHEDRVSIGSAPRRGSTTTESTMPPCS